MGLPISIPIIKPVDALCNLNCSYCYAGIDGTGQALGRMNLQTLKQTIDFFCKNQGEEVEFIWHGGEPLLAGKAFYHRVVELQRPWVIQGKKITNILQTNATLVTQKWAHFLAERGFVVGTSLDGPQKLHDKFRKHKTGKGSYKKVVRGINLLRNAGIFGGVICGVTVVNYENPQKLLDFFVAEGIKKLKFMRIRTIGCCDNVHVPTLSAEQFTDFMIAIFDYWLELDDPEIEIRDIQSVVNVLLGGRVRECVYMGRCEQFATVYSDGSIRACDSFPKSESTHFGSVTEEHKTVRNNPNLKTFEHIIMERKKSCWGCSWYFMCQGGCMKDNYLNLGSRTPRKEVCRNLKRYFSHIRNRLEAYGLLTTGTALTREEDEYECSHSGTEGSAQGKAGCGTRAENVRQENSTGQEMG